MNRAGALEVSEYLRDTSDFDYECVVHLQNLVVDETHRGKGIGNALCDKVMKQAKEWYCPRVALEVEKVNTGAFSLYEKMGFTTVYENEDAHAAKVTEKGVVSETVTLLRMEMEQEDY